MALTQAQRTLVERARAIGGGEQGVALSESACAYIVGTIVADLDLKASFPEFPRELPPFFGEGPVEALEIPNVHFLQLFERLVEMAPDTDTYFVSLAKLLKSRLKYEKILRAQPIPTLEQVGPRALLEFGKLRPQALSSFIFWRKWIFDIDNRAAQETGYLFEPIIASAIGGVSATATQSPVRRRKNPSKGRQVDCIRGDRAYEFKLRVTIAASGQGRWSEELDFPRDCRQSGFIPVLVVLDSTPNPKLDELCSAFESENGKVYVGDAAWKHLNDMAGPTMAAFLGRYVHGPMAALLQGEEAPRLLPPLTLQMRRNEIAVEVGTDGFSIVREVENEGTDKAVSLPEDVD